MQEQMRLVESTALPNGASIRRYAHAGVELDDAPPCGDDILAFRTSGAVVAERKLADHWRRAATRHGSITILPAGQRTSWRLQGEGSILHLHLPRPFLEHVTEGQGSDSRIAVVERLGVRDARIGRLVEALLRETREGKLAANLYSEALILQIAVCLLRGYARPRGEAGRPVATAGLRDSVQTRVLDYIEANLDGVITLAELAKVADLGLTRFSQGFRAAFGTSPYQHVTELRVARAKALLADTDSAIVEIALACGFAHQAHLTTTFKRVCGQTPAAYRALRRS